MKDFKNKSIKPVGFSNTQRDSYQSLGAGLMSASERVEAEPNLTKVGWSSAQTAGGTNYHVPMMQGRNPLAEIKKLTQAYEGIEHSMLLRGDVQVAYDMMPDDVIENNMREHAKAGINVFTIFDGLDDFENMRVPISWANRLREDEGYDTHAQGVICVGQSQAYTMDLYKSLAEKLVNAGVRDLYIKDPCGVTLPDTMNELVTHLKRDFNLPVWMHMHDTHGLAIPTYLAGIEAGADNIDVAHPAFAGNVAQPCAFRMMSAMQDHPNQMVSDRVPQLDQDAIMADYASLLFMRMRLSDYEPKFEPDVLEELYAALAPGGASSTLKPIFARNFESELGLDWRESQLEIYRFQTKMLHALGNPLQVTPHAKSTTDSAAISRYKNANPKNPSTWTLSSGTKKLLTGQSGKHPGNPDAKLVKRALREEGMSEPMTGRPADHLNPMMGKARKMLSTEADKIEDEQGLKAHWSQKPPSHPRNTQIVEALRNPSTADVVTVAMWNNEKQEGLTFVLDKIHGRLNPKPSPQFDLEALSQHAGVKEEAAINILEEAGGIHEIERIAQAVLELEKIGYYRTGYENVEDISPEQQARQEYLETLYQKIAKAAEEEIREFFDQAADKSNDSKHGNQYEDVLYAMVRTRSTAKGVSDATHNKIMEIRAAIQPLKLVGGTDMKADNQPHIAKG